jgi:putrescine transport system permease protein
MRRWFDRVGWKQMLLGIPYLWMLLWFAVPCLIVLAMSLAMSATAAPPFGFRPDWPFVRFDNFIYVFGEPIYLRAYLVSAWNAGVATLLCLLIGYPVALAITRTSRAARNVVLMLVILPFWVSFLLRIYAWMGLMGSTSWFNQILTAMINLGLPAGAELESVRMMNTNFAVVLVMVYSYLPFMVLPLYANLERLDPALNEASTDLGARPWQVFRDVTLPLSLPGIVAGALLTFIPAMGEVIIPSLVGDASDPMIGRVISDEFIAARDWPLASAIAVLLLVLLVVPIILYDRFETRAQRGAE